LELNFSYNRSQAHFGVSIHGDIDIIPAGIASEWTLKKQDCALVIQMPQDILREARHGKGSLNQHIRRILLEDNFPRTVMLKVEPSARLNSSAVHQVRFSPFPHHRFS
jgi:hypothetical protein